MNLLTNFFTALFEFLVSVYQWVLADWKKNSLALIGAIAIAILILSIVPGWITLTLILLLIAYFFYKALTVHDEKES